MLSQRMVLLRSIPSCKCIIVDGTYFFLLCSILSCKCTIVFWSIHLLMGTYVASSAWLLWNCAATNLGVHRFFWIRVSGFLGYNPSVESPGQNTVNLNWCILDINNDLIGNYVSPKCLHSSRKLSTIYGNFSFSFSNFSPASNGKKYFLIVFHLCFCLFIFYFSSPIPFKTNFAHRQHV